VKVSHYLVKKLNNRNNECTLRGIEASISQNLVKRKMAHMLNKRELGSILLITVPIIVLIWQQLTGTIPLRAGTPDSAIFSILMGLAICTGFAIIEKGPRGMFRNFIISAALLLGLPLIISGLIAGNDVANGTTLSEGKGWFFTMDVIGSQVTEWSWLIQTIVGIIPAAVIVVGIVMIYLSDNPDEMETPIIETMVVVVIIVIATMAFGWLGVDLW